MMHLQWHAVNGAILDIREPDQEIPDPPYVYLTSSGFGGGGCDVQTVTAPYQHGSTFLAALLVPRSLSLTFMIRAQDTEDLYARRRAITRAFSPAAGEGRLVWIQGERSFSLRCVVGSASPAFPQGRQSAGPTWQTVTVDLTASDPCWFEDALEQHLQGLAGGLAFPVAFPAHFAFVSPTVTIDNPGDVESPVTIRVTGPALNPVITNATTGESIGLTVDLAPGEWVEIRTAFGAASCRLHDGSSAMGAVQPGSTFWQLQPGENIVTLSTPSGSVVVSIEYASRYTGV
ncbi:phage distal tail protein [Methanoculleus sp. UBA45]|uniref:phage distal tail protein n=1 Tax=Methanoculleus sp. UBA45 TaxID=1915512 RepID=UPI0031BA194C